MIVIINGALGVGKTEVSWKLLGLFERGVMLDGDYIGAIHPFEIYDDERVEYLYQTLTHMVGFHRSNGYRNFVINYVFENPESLSRLRHMLVALDPAVYVFRLTCNRAQAEARLKARGREQLPWELNRYQELSAIQQAASLRGDMGYQVDTSALNPLQVAQRLWNLIHEEIEIAPYDAAWPQKFQAEADAVKALLGDLIGEIHHIGSTAVPGLAAKPIIDLLVTVPQLEDAVACIAPLQELGYRFVDHPENRDRRYFKKGVPRTYHLHIVAQDSPSIRVLLAFRDLLRADTTLRADYAALKKRLATRHKDQRMAYTTGKTEFVETALATASNAKIPFE